MLRTGICLAAALLVAGSLNTASAQTSTAPAAAPATTPAPAAKPSKMKFKEMRAKWRENKPKYTACRKEVKAKGLAGDDRWFYIQDCMAKS
ncbi:MAG: hypothetical protein ABJA75_11605 [Bradyrhizobium sp.]